KKENRKYFEEQETNSRLLIAILFDIDLKEKNIELNKTIENLREELNDYKKQKGITDEKIVDLEAEITKLTEQNKKLEKNTSNQSATLRTAISEVASSPNS
ncbi:MAG: Spo0E family sporulation regulatory protein-aspartic acid phosphatase, partial [Rickettsia sp.]|nr:Spo0E family sporulation regulatory protein-aspartic acid phosphatase [Rickettsia sp.]